MDNHEQFMDKVRNISVEYIKPLVISDKDAIKIPFNEDEEFVDDKVVFKKVVDAFVIDHMLGKPESKMSFLNLIASAYNDVIGRYKTKHNLKNQELLFIYKGGNILRIHKKRAMQYLPAKTQLLVNEKYDPDFQKSDDDFTIYIDPNHRNFNYIIDDIKSLSFSVLEVIRDELAAHRKEYFDFYNYDDVKKNEVLMELGEKISTVFDDLKANEVESQYNGFHFMELKFDDPAYILTNKMSKINIDGTWTQLIDKNDFRTKLLVDNNTTAFRHDFGMKNSQDDKYHMLSSLDLVGSNKSPIFLSNNETLTFTKASGITSFILQRAKLNMKMFIQKDGKHNFTNIAGELIDVSIPNKIDSGLLSFYHKIQEKDLSHYVENYTFEYSGKRFNLNCYTIDYLIDDLGRMLFVDSEFPWDDSKYAKRIRRLFFLYLIKLLSSDHTFDEIAGFFLQTRGIFGEDSYESVQPYVGKFNFMTTFFENFFGLKPKIGTEEDMVKYDDYVKTVTDNFDFLAGVFKNQIEVSRTIPLEDSVIGAIVSRSIDNKVPITVEQLGGNDLYYYKKYLKYKGKFLREKNKSYY